ncbi:HdeD family acid-resistance protein [Propionibacterium sp.]|uniref:HdeD family acid-resistance protein n=1 Tax=Propionibacterium sp. TaxID=1977903 RepID=UPI0039ED9BCF
MSETIEKKPITNGIRTALGIGGLVALITGILILVWPGKVAMVVTAIIAIYVIIAGIVYAAMGIFNSAKGGWSRFGYIILGALFIIAGIVAFTQLGETALWLGTFLAIMVGILWIIDGIVSFSTLGDAGSKVTTILFAVLSIIAGIVLFLSPMWGAVVLWWLLGISLVVLGIMNIVRAFSFGRAKTA